MNLPSFWNPLTPAEGIYTFGYYDRHPWSTDNRWHLALKIPHQERLPTPEERAQIGIVETGTQTFTPLTETRTWCHQQGAMTLWLPRQSRQFLYNDWNEDTQSVTAHLYDLDEGLRRRYPMPVYNISPDGRYAVSLNFSRIPRRGYSYAMTPLPEGHLEPDWDNDGLFLMDLETAETTLLISYRQLKAIHLTPWELDRQYLWLNHAIFNIDGSRLMVLFRHRPERDRGRWSTNLITCDLQGKDIRYPINNLLWRGAITHQIWGRYPDEILVDANWTMWERPEYVVIRETQTPPQAQRISAGCGKPGHLNFSPDGQWMLADTYPHDGIQTLCLVRVSDGECRIAGQFRHDVPGVGGDWRCDLHPRWSPDGSLISVDTIHRGNRAIYWAKLEDILAEFEHLPSP